MTDHRPAPDTAPATRSALSRAALVLGIVALVLTVVGVFWLRLWIAGLPLGVIALVLSLISAGRDRRAGWWRDASTLISLLAVVLSAVIAVVFLIGGLLRADGGSTRETLDVQLRVQAEGDFSVTYTGPPAAGSDARTITEVNATDEFVTSFTADVDFLQLQAGIDQSNIGPQQIRCEVSIDGTVVLERVGDRRYVDCTTELQELYREQLGPDAPAS